MHKHSNLILSSGRIPHRLPRNSLAVAAGRFIKISFILLSLALLAQACGPVGDVDILETMVDSEYSFDPDSILGSIRAGQRDVFHLEWESRVLTPRPAGRPMPIPSRSPVAWSEADFVQVVQASIDFLGKQPTVGTRLYSVVFRTPCQYADVGPQYIGFGYFRVIASQAEEGYDHYSLRHVRIDTEVGRLGWDEREMSQVLREEGALEREKSHIPAEIALTIAEKAGGVDFRASLGNACSVTGRLTAGIVDSEWEVTYESHESPSATFEVRIDKETGEGRTRMIPAP